MKMLGEMVKNSLTDVAARIRGNQIHAMESNVPKALIGYLVAVAVVILAAHAEWAELLKIWAPVTFFVCVVRIAVAYRTARGPVTPLGARTERLLMVLTGIVSLTMAIGPTWIALHSEGFVCALMIMLLVSTMWGGALVQAPVFSSAVSFTIANVPVWLVYLALSGVTWDRFNLALLFFVTVAVAIDNVNRYANNFERGLRQQIDLEEQSVRLRQQADVIALLLKEHEDQSSDWLWQTDGGGRIVRPSPRFAEAFSCKGTALAGATLVDLFLARDVPGNAEALDLLAEHFAEARSFRDFVVPGMLDGLPRWWSVSGRPISDDAGAVIGYRGVMGDVTIAKRAQAQIVHLAHHDALTGLANRAYFHQRLDVALASPGGKQMALVSIDLDGFKPVNDRYGHPVGDALLIAIADRLRAVTANNGTVARLGGDEFAIEADIAEPAAMEGLCRRLIKSLNVPYQIAGHEITVGASIGVAFAPTDGRTTEELTRNADAALYRAKRDGRGTYRFFAPEMDRQLQARMLLLQDLRDALGKRQFALHYQPFVESATGVVTGCEALIRWYHPTHGQISPADFIPLAEESGLIVPIGAWAIETACVQAATWPDDKRVSVNISPAQFIDRDLPNHILAVLLQTGLAPHRLEIEVTEAVLIEDAEAALDILRRIRATGVRIALDDFGTGYSSLSYLRNFPFDKVKIDRSFITEIESRRDSQIIVQGIHDIARGLGMTITAEGVETCSQAMQLRKAGCHELQGFLFSKPQPEANIQELLNRHYDNGHAVQGADMALGLERIG